MRAGQGGERGVQGVCKRLVASLAAAAEEERRGKMYSVFVIADDDI